MFPRLGDSVALVALSLSFAAAHGFSLFPTLVRQEQPLLLPQSCTTAQNCIAGCVCIGDADAKFCTNSTSYEGFLAGCKNCTVDSDCKLTVGKEADQCSNSTKKCLRCTLDASKHGIMPCSDLTTAKPVCVSSQWLVDNHMQHNALEFDIGISRVLCLPERYGLPCGTPGHLLLDSNSNSNRGQLVSYKEVCDDRLDCTETTMSVSQLRHDLDWSTYGTDKLRLTSLSAHPASTRHSRYSPSRAVARLAHALNTYGFSSVCNAVSLAPHRLQSALWNLRAAGASSY